MFNNVVKLNGNLGADPKVIESESCKFAVFSLATSEKYKDKASDDWKNTETTWHDVITFRQNLIEKLITMKKGDFLEVKGNLSYRPFEIIEQGGKKVTKKEASVIATTIELVQSRQRG
jgi:single-stranded DNA-binding protein